MSDSVNDRQWGRERGRRRGRLKECQTVWDFTMKLTKTRWDKREVHLWRNKACPFPTSKPDRRCHRDVCVRGGHTAWPLICSSAHEVLLSFGLFEAKGSSKSEVIFTQIFMFIDLVAPHGGVQRAQGASQKLQPLLLWSLQSGKKPGST